MRRRHVFFSIVSIIVCGLLVSCVPVMSKGEAENADEQAIVHVIERIVAAFNNGDLKAQLAAYAPDATIESLVARGTPMSRDQYAALRQRWTPSGTVYLRSLSVHVLSANEAKATALFRLVDGNQDILGRRDFRLARRNGQWLVVDARFVGPLPWDHK